MDRTRIERKMSEIVDWSTVKFHTDMIEEFIGKMERHQLDYTGDIRWELERLEQIFQEAEDRAKDELLKEDDAELEEEYEKNLPVELTIVSDKSNT